MPNNEPRKIKTLAVKGDAAENGGDPGGCGRTCKTGRGCPIGVRRQLLRPSVTHRPPMPAPTRRCRCRHRARQRPIRRRRPVSPPPIRSRRLPSAGGGYLVQVSSQKNEADAQASYRALQSKFPAVLGSRPPVIKRADLGDKGVYYRAMVGPFGSTEEAAQFCGNLKTAGGQCVVQRN